MNLKVHRAVGAKNVIIEIFTAQAKILLDGGMSLEENEVLSPSELAAAYAFSDVSAVFLSHYGTDHITLAAGSADGVPVYTGKLAGRIGAAAQKYKAKKPRPFAGYYASGATIIVGDMKVTPYLIDDAIYDGFVLLVEGDGKSVLYTGDYRANGRKSFEEMVKNLPVNVDVMLCEGGVITAADVNPITERDLEEQAAKLMKDKKGPVFILQAATDFDRATTMFHAAKRNKRVFLEDLYMAQLAAAAGKAMPNPNGWTGVKAYLTTGYKAEHFRYQMFTELPRMNKAEIETQKFAMCVRVPMKKYMKTLSQGMRFTDGLLIDTLPDAVRATEAAQVFIAFAAQKGLAVATLRNSGHADAMAMRALIEAVKPKKLLPLTLPDVKWFAAEFPKTAIVSENEIVC